MVKDPLHATCLPVHIGTLVELGKANGKMYINSCAINNSVNCIKFLERCLLLFFLTFLYFSSAELFYLSHKLVDLYPNNPVSIDDVYLHKPTLFEILYN